MKLNQQRPNNGWTSIYVKISLWLLALTLPFALADEAAAKNQTHWGTQIHQESSSGQNVSAVSDLRLTADLRAVRLSWRYPYEESNRPKAFSIRYCELTSWNVEIKCRHKELLVGDSRTQLEAQLSDTQGHNSSEGSDASRARQEGQQMHPTPPMQQTVGRREKSVIKSPEEFVLSSRESANKFEGEIYDLRALTNYTFQVRPSPSDQQQQQQPDGRRAAARYLADVAGESSGRVETKPFAARASKCLADVSEVVINTGRYFGGRISVEGSADKRCSLLGNRSSEQTSYTFRVDHQRCASRIVDGKRIETMILVHENKDLLTHNTARFLVVCNFLQQSFTVRASVSLPKVNAQVRQRRPAIVQQLNGRPTNTNNQQEPSVSSITLGSMRGTYRSRAAGEQADDLVSNTIDRSSEDGLRELPANSTLMQQPPSQQTQRQPKELPTWRRTSDSTGLPAPVQVSSGLLLIEGSSTKPLRAAKQLQQPQQWRTTAEPGERTQLTRSQSDATNSPLTDNSSMELRADASEQVQVDLHAPVIITNNHRVSGNFPTLNGQLTAPKSAHPTGWPANSTDGLSIKYSADKIDEYPLEAGGLADQLARAQANSRGGRMRSVEPGELGDPLDSPQSEPNPSINRMGESAVNSSESKEPLEIVQPSAVSGNPTLAYNLTSYLLRWSLRTLTSLARKSLESLAKVNGSVAELPAQEESVGSDGRQFGTDQSTSRLDLAAERTTQPAAELSATRQRQTEATKSATTTTTTTTTTESPPTTELLDGFLTNRRRTSERTASTGPNANANEATPTLAPTTSPPRSVGRPSNYSKSIDFMRADNPTKHRQTDTGKAAQSPISERRSGETSQRSPNNQSAVVNENRRNSRALSSWLLCVILGVASLVIGIFATLWLLQPTGPTTKRLMFASANSSSNNNYACEQAQVTARQTALARPNISNIDCLASPARLLASPSVQSSRSAGRSSTGSGSCTSSGSHEHDCKDSELLYTEHVLIDTDADSGESYA